MPSKIWNQCKYDLFFCGSIISDILGTSHHNKEQTLPKQKNSVRACNYTSSCVGGSEEIHTIGSLHITLNLKPIYFSYTTHFKIKVFLYGFPFVMNSLMNSNVPYNVILHASLGLFSICYRHSWLPHNAFSIHSFSNSRENYTWHAREPFSLCFTGR